MSREKASVETRFFDDAGGVLADPEDIVLACLLDRNHPTYLSGLESMEQNGWLDA